MSANTSVGQWKAPIRFLPLSALMACLSDSTPSNMLTVVVGTCTSRTPRKHSAAISPAMLPVMPPPTATTHERRVMPSASAVSHSSPSVARRLAASPPGQRSRWARPSARTSGAACSSATVSSATTKQASASSARMRSAISSVQRLPRK